MVLVPTSPNDSGQIPHFFLEKSDHLVKVSGPVALKPDETAFVEKTLHYISGIRGAVQTNLTLSTNTKYPSRYIVMIQGLPTVVMSDFATIRNTNGRIRNILVNMVEASIRVDVWRGSVKKNRIQKRIKKRNRQKSRRIACDMSNVEQRDQKCILTLLQYLSNMQNVECQFTAIVDTSNPEFYNIHLHIVDSICIQEIETIMHNCRSFCVGIEFDFPHKVVRAKCLRLAAPLRRRRLTLKK